MQPYNIEIFDRNFDIKQHYNTENVSYTFDYLDIVENTTLVPYSKEVERGQYIRLTNGENTYFGVISGIDVGSEVEGFSEIRYKPFMSIFDTDVMFDTNWQPQAGAGSTLTMEEVIVKLITDYWIANTDDDANIPGLEAEEISTTPDWGLHLTSDVKDLHKTIVNFNTSIISRALTKYQIGVYVEPDMNSKAIRIQVGRKETAVFKIEADLQSVLDRKIVLNSTTTDTNKLVIYDSADLETHVIYYKHTDGTHDMTDADRIIPVIQSIQSVNTSQDTTFAQAAQEAADKTFDTDTYNNLIEIEVKSDDQNVTPGEMGIGRLVEVITQGAIYPSIMTGYVKGNTTRLIFGTIRVEASKKLKRLLKNGG